MTLPAALHALALALLHFVWQGALLGVIALGAARALSSRDAALRYAVLHGLLWAMALAFAWTYAWLLGQALGSHRPADIDPTTATRTGPMTLLGGAVLVAWSIGAAHRGLRLGLGLAGVARWRRRAVELPPRWSDALAELAREMGVRASVRIAALAGLDAPIVVGVLRPLVLVPLACVAGVPTAAMRAALAHELAHVLRHDYLLQLCHAAIEAVLFFHPAVRWLCARLRIEREYCCDDLATARLFDPLDYARGLAELEGARAVASPALAAHGASLMSRIDRLLHAPATAPCAPVRAAAITAWLGIGLAFAPTVIVPACVATHDDVEPAPVLAARDEARDVTASPSRPDVRLAVPWLAEPLADHAAAIAEAAARHGIDPSLLAIVTWVESRGDARASSPAGARGLMQLMPGTAAKIARERGLAGHSDARLDDPAYNLDLGAYHLAELLDDYGGGDELDADTVALAAAAYNGGRARADAWLGGAALPDETDRYKDVVVALWQARGAAAAPRL
ncbi:MAG: transglycosylase SLT domain-containing protein [Deltaproteobacteria bacterium]|nr:transglycosylase SLT domain-containing protein [Deltaproteobacteria bacterium]MBK8717121.1 transglycosylase SLT domain-containing protein [Deltaproteobacteria bacterium]MBP7286355.1 transglycosylase SLT domain-containing protein [Nannocystaceae bacterium]